MPRYIDADKLKDDIRKWWIRDWRLVSMLDDIDHVPTADVQEVKHGHWFISEYESLNCSVCGEAYFTGADSMEMAKHWIEEGYVYTFCPYCGTKMDEKEKEK